MDDKQKSMICTLVNKINQEIFDELDILSLLILIREIAPDKGLTNELGHFIAHRTRDKGQFYNYLLSNTDWSVDVSIEKNAFSALVHGKSFTTPEEILTDINATLEGVGANSLNKKLTTAIAHCIASLLQKIEFEEVVKDEKTKLKTRTPRGKTYIIYTPKGAALIAEIDSIMKNLFQFDAPYNGNPDEANRPNNFVRVFHDHAGTRSESL